MHIACAAIPLKTKQAATVAHSHHQNIGHFQHAGMKKSNTRKEQYLFTCR
jgi:hypothetical protein